VGTVARSKDKFGASFRRHAQFLADRVIDFQAQPNRFARLLRRHNNRKNNALFVAERLAGLVGEQMRCGVKDSRRLQIFRTRKVEVRWNPRIARISPISLPAGLHLDLDAGAQLRIAIFAASSDKSGRRADIIAPG
jgi:hypothetical protein